MALDARSRSSIYQKLVPTLGEHDANVLMSEFPSVEADELVTKQFLRAELATSELATRDFISAELAGFHAAMDARFEAADDRFTTKDFVRAEFADQRTWMEAQMHRQTVWLGGALAGATALLATLGALTP